MRRMTIIGIVLVVVGIVIGIGLGGFGIALKASSDPKSSNEGIITSSGGVAELSSGKYQIWVTADVNAPVIARGPNNVTFTVKQGSDEVEYDDLNLWGKFDVDEGGEYRFEFNGTGDMYITDDFSLGTYSFMTYGGGGLGVVLLLAGIVLIIVGRKRQEALDHSGFFHEGPPK
ncbi:MAG: hypothetical protein ACMUHM_07800 [Thermoplasmatota archaeon]